MLVLALVFVNGVLKKMVLMGCFMSNHHHKLHRLGSVGSGMLGIGLAVTARTGVVRTGPERIGRNGKPGIGAKQVRSGLAVEERQIPERRSVERIGSTG